MFGYSSYLDKSMNGIKTISDGVALIQNGNATFNTINVETITSSNLTDCNLNNCTTNDPTTPQSVANKEYVDDNFVNRTNNLNQDINGIKTFLSVPICSTNATTDFQLINKKYAVDNFCDLGTNQLVGGQKTFLGDMITQNITCTSALYFIDLANALSTNTPQIYMEADIFYFDTNPTYDNEWHFWCAGNPRLTISQYSTEINNPLNVHEDATFSKQATFDNFTPICSVASPTANNHLTRKDYIDNNFLDRTNNLTQNINGFKTFTNDTTFNSQATFNTLCPISSVNPTAGNHLTRRDYVENNFVDKTSNQTIAGIKTFNGNTIYNGTALYCNCPGEFANLVHLRNFTRMYDVISPFTNYTQLYTSANNFIIYPVIANSGIHFYCRTSGNVEVQTFISSATTNTSLVPFVASSTATVNGEATFNTWVNLNFRTRIYALNQLGNYTQMYMINDNEFIIAPEKNGDFISFYCKDATLGQLQTFTSSALGNTSNVKLTCSSSLVSNNLTSPTTTTTNNIYTTLVSGGVINMGGLLGSNNIAGLTTLSEATTFNDTAKFKTGIEIYNGVNVSIIKQATNFLNIKNLFQGGSISLETTAVVGGAADRLIISHTSCDILPDTLNLTSSSTINILTPNNLTGVIHFLSTLTTATINFCSTTFTSVFFLNARLAHKQVQYMNEVKILSGTSHILVFPLEQRWQFTSTGATQVVVDLPELTASHQAGFNFSFYKTASNTNSVKFNRQGTNVIRSLNSITDLTTITLISGSSITGGFLTAELSAGNFAWIYI